MSHRYRAYGLQIESQLAFAELLPGEGPVDVVVREGRVDWRPPVDAEKARYASPDEICLYWRGAGVFAVRGGREIVVDPEDGLDELTTSLLVLGPAFAAILHQRGLLVLHASAVSIDGRAAVFVGEKGRGKSTMAVAMQRRGHELLSDDVVAVDFDGSTPHILPAFPQAKLWPSAAAAFGLAPGDLAPLHRDYTKRAFRSTVDFPTAPAPVNAVYALAYGESVAIRPLDARSSALELIRHTYLARYLSGTRTEAHHLGQVASLARTTRVALLERPADLGRLDDVATAVERDVAGCWSALAPRRVGA